MENEVRLFQNKWSTALWRRNGLSLRSQNPETESGSSHQGPPRGHLQQQSFKIFYESWALEESFSLSLQLLPQLKPPRCCYPPRIAGRENIFPPKKVVFLERENLDETRCDLTNNIITLDNHGEDIRLILKATRYLSLVVHTRSVTGSRCVTNKMVRSLPRFSTDYVRVLSTVVNRDY